MISKKIDHIGIAVHNLKKACETYKALGLKVSKIEAVSDMNVNVAFLPVGDTRFELLEPLHKDSVISKFLEKKGEGVHHICLEVEDIEAASKELMQSGFQVLYPKAKKGAEGAWVNFLHPKSTHGILIEICCKHISPRGHEVAEKVS
ncbi:MAG: methylmalonyl-CoA epimerase [Deltaproteobacteria bacterium RIFCSPHIGHO2_02_FULL_40_11]|nr:MAG: methylmalonyl-CoA epimerase [Deltaproteobacteria bacterium RIFCSPHIGHO2_02_FULL_40_11]